MRQWKWSYCLAAHAYSVLSGHPLLFGFGLIHVHGSASWNIVQHLKDPGKVIQNMHIKLFSC